MFEGRKTRTKSVAFCGNHGIRACLTTPNLSLYKNKKFEIAVHESTNEELAMWRCSKVSDSCWSKAHHFYIRKGLWGQESAQPTGNDQQLTFRHHGVRLSSDLYKNKEDWMLRHRLISTKGGTRGRKSRKRKPTTEAKQSTTRQTKRRRGNVASPKITTTEDDEITLSELSEDNDQCDASTDSSLLQDMRQQVAV